MCLLNKLMFQTDKSEGREGYTEIATKDNRTWKSLVE